MNDLIHYDIIADIHGRFDKLSALMERMGYQNDGGSFVPPAGHKALFLGDLIDPKPGHFLPGGVLATLRAVKAMCDRGDALCLMGNHELNAIYFHTADPNGRSSDPDRNWLRYRGSKNRAMHQGTLDDFENYDDPQSEWHQVWIPWMKALPFFLDLGSLRAVHATWHPEMIARLAGRSFDDEDFFLACSGKHTPEGEALEILLKGVEVPLPPPHTIKDHTGEIRKNFRARWWEAVSREHPCCDLVFPPSEQIKSWPVAEEALPMFQPYDSEAPPVFFGHYFKPADSPLAPERHNVACLDHSAAKDGPLVAYRWKGEASIKPEHYIINS
jgi:hypothetical protein